MKNKKIKIFISILIMVLFLFLGGSTSKAASASISASSKEVTAGTKVTITVSGSAKAWSLKASGSGISNSIVGGNLSSKSNQSFSESYSLNTSTPGTYTVSLTGDVTDATGDFKEISSSVTVKVSEKKADTPASNNNNNNNNNNTNKNNNKNNNNNNSNNNSENNKPVPEEKEPTFKAVNEKVYATGDINVRKSYSADSTKLGSLKKGEEIARTGVGDNGWSKVTYNGGTGYIKSNLLTTEQPKKSEDKALKSLEITGFEINPAFDPEITDYTVAVGLDVEKVEIKAIANDEKATVNIPEAQALVAGDNLIKITVTAEDQTTRTYTITATKQAEEIALGLTSLKVDGYTLEPKFSPNVYEYKITVMDPSVNSLNITALSDNTNAKVETIGNTSIKDGENTITINVKSEDGSKTTTYRIIVTKNATAVISQDSSNNWILYAGIGIIVFLIILIITVIVIARRKAEYEDDEEYDEEDDDENNNYDGSDDYSDLYGYSSKNSTKAVDTNMKDSDIEKSQNFQNSMNENNSQSTINDSFENKTEKYEDNFKYNAYTTKDLYGDTLNTDNTKSDLNVNDNSGYYGNKDVNYYNNKVSEIFDNSEKNLNKTSQDSFGYMTTDESVTEDDWEDDSKSRRSRGKHSK